MIYAVSHHIFGCFMLSLAVFSHGDQNVPVQDVTNSLPHENLKSNNASDDFMPESFTTETPNVSHAGNSSDASPKSDNVTKIGELSASTSAVPTTSTGANESWPDYVKYCPSNVACEKLSPNCIDCDFNETCIYGRNTSVVCRPKDMIICLGPQNFTKWHSCQYCYQTASHLHLCTNSTGCKVVSAPRQVYQANCTVNSNTLCLGKRSFYKMLPCNWASGKRWSTALVLSITLGGFGADRFYLGLWREGIGKLFSFGGLGVWTLVDVVLVATGYIGPADGSLYIW